MYNVWIVTRYIPFFIFCEYNEAHLLYNVSLYIMTSVFTFVCARTHTQIQKYLKGDKPAKSK